MSRPVVLLFAHLALASASLAASPPAPRAILPEGLELVTAAAAPLVKHPLMACLGADGALYVGDAAGLNLGKADLEKQLPNRVLKLVDTNRDGIFDTSTVFADKMTFPQGGCWLEGSLYVASPPGIWKLTDTDKDGVADQREMIVGGFEFTGNAADVHGPFLHPNGRLYWCHGRKGHRVVQKPNAANDVPKVVHEGLASGIWSCQPDGSDVAWHSLGSADNPTEIDFTPEGDIIGTCNLYHSQPRGDTLMHWLYGGVYERPDQLKAIEGLPRTLEHMPVLHNFGHVAVSGCAFARTGTLFPAAQQQHMLVTHFNTQRVVRMELNPEGATYTATQHEFLHLPDSPDVHFTDVLEDKDGSLLVIDTGGWFRIGCPSSLMAKPDVSGAVYRVRRKEASTPLAKTTGSESQRSSVWKGELKDEKAALECLQSSDPKKLMAGFEAVSRHRWNSAEIIHALALKLGEPLAEPLEHGVLHAAHTIDLLKTATMNRAQNPLLDRRLLVLAAMDPATRETDNFHQLASRAVASSDPLMLDLWLRLATSPPAKTTIYAKAVATLVDAGHPLSAAQLSVIEKAMSTMLAAPEPQTMLASWLARPSTAENLLALKILAGQTAGVRNETWTAPLKAALDKAGPAELPLLLDAMGKVRDKRFDQSLEIIANDAARAPSIRLKALAAKSTAGTSVSTPIFAFLQKLLADPVNASVRIEAARRLASAKLDQTQLKQVADSMWMLGPLELGEIFKGLRKYGTPDQGRLIATGLATSPVLGSFELSQVKTLFSLWPPDTYNIVAPVLKKHAEVVEAKKARLASLAVRAQNQGKPADGRTNYANGKGGCVACHKIGEAGRPIGPDISKIGAIRTERDLLESILFPDNTLARDYEAHSIETADGQSVTGVIKSHTAEGLLVMDVAGQEKSLRHQDIIANTTLTTSLMPAGLETTMTEQELCDMVAWLRSLK